MRLHENKQLFRQAVEFTAQEKKILTIYVEKYYWVTYVLHTIFKNKIGEEAVEVILAAKSQGDQRVVEETADLVYHLLVLLVSRDLSWDDIRGELESRHQ